MGRSRGVKNVVQLYLASEIVACGFQPKQSPLLDLYQKQQRACVYCGVYLTHLNVVIEHIVARRWGGSNNVHEGNIVLACEKCNGLKARLENLALRDCPTVSTLDRVDTLICLATASATYELSRPKSNRLRGRVFSRFAELISIQREIHVEKWRTDAAQPAAAAGTGSDSSDPA